MIERNERWIQIRATCVFWVMQRMKVWPLFHWAHFDSTIRLAMRANLREWGLPGKTFVAEGLFPTVCWDSPTWWTPARENIHHRTYEIVRKVDVRGRTNIFAGLLFELTRPGTTRLSGPNKSFFSSRSFWKFSILIRLPWSWSTTSDTSARAATDRAGAGDDYRRIAKLYCCVK